VATNDPDAVSVYVSGKQLHPQRHP